MELKYFMPTKVLMDKGVIEKNYMLFKEYGKKAYIITGRKSSKINGSLNDVISALNKAEIEYSLFDEVEENPSLETIEKASSIGKKENIDFVIGIGGGSPIDASKAIAVMIKNENLSIDDVLSGKNLSALNVVAVPTTSGTGTETTQYSIVTDHKKKTKMNLGQIVFPKLSLLDPTYTENMSIETTISTAVDAFSHIVEGYLNKNATIITDALSEKALGLFGECIDSLLAGEISYEIREKLMLSSTIAGIIIAQTGTSLPHGMGYALTYFKNIPHGLSNGCLYIEYLRVFKNREKVDKIHKLLNLESHNNLEKILEKLTRVEADISTEEIESYSKSMYENKGKLQNHIEEVSYEDIYNIYFKSLIK